MKDKKIQISGLWIATMLELFNHLKSLACNVSSERWRLARHDLACAQAVRDLAVAMFDGLVAMPWDGNMLSLDEIDHIIDSQEEIIATYADKESD